MAITLAQAPRTAFQAVDPVVRAFSVRSAGTPALRAANPERLAIDSPHEVFALGLADLASGAGLPAARPVGWRYLVREDGRAIALAEARAVAGGTHAFSHVNEGPYVDSTARALADLERLEEARHEDFEGRVLEVPALHCTALWLRPLAEGSGDLLIPLAPAPAKLTAGRARPAPEILAALAAEADRAGLDQDGEA